MDVMANRAELVAALRSGEYRRGRMSMRNKDDEYCPLGVSCEIYHKHYPESSGWDESCSPTRYAFRVDGSENLYLHSAPFAVCEFFGFNGFTAGIIMINNDTIDMSFGEIADFIESLPIPEKE